MVDRVPKTRQETVEADLCDPIARYREEFVIVPGGPIYLDGNSLGRQPRAARAAIAALMDEWGRDLVSGWDRWMDLPGAVGDRIGALVGAGPGQVVLSDSTTVNLHKLALAAVGSMAGRRVIVGDANDFPTVRYVLQGIAAREDRDLKLLATDPVEGVGPAAIADAVSEDVALVCLSGVNYRSGALVDLAEVTGAAHRAGAMVLWDLSHAAGAVPVELDATGADLAVGCSYKYLNGGPGAPAWLYVRSDLQERLRQPIWGWWGQRDQFAMGPSYDPVPGMYRFLAGTPAVLGMVAVDAGVAPLLSAGMPALWAKARQLVALLSQARRGAARTPRGQDRQPRRRPAQGRPPRPVPPGRVGRGPPSHRARPGCARLQATRRAAPRPGGPLHPFRRRVGRGGADRRGARRPRCPRPSPQEAGHLGTGGAGRCGASFLPRGRSRSVVVSVAGRAGGRAGP